MHTRPRSCCPVSLTVSGRCIALHTRPRSCCPVSSTVPGRCIPIQVLLASFYNGTRTMHTPSKLPACNHDRLKSRLGLTPVVLAASLVLKQPLTAGRRTRVQTVSTQLGTVLPATPVRFFARPSWSTLASKSWRGPCSGLLITGNVIMARLYIYRNLWKIY
jgi:hypothetical protein